MQDIIARQALAQNGWEATVEISIDNEWDVTRTGGMAIAAPSFGGIGLRPIREVRAAGRHVIKEERQIARDAVTGQFTATLAELEQGI